MLRREMCVQMKLVHASLQVTRKEYSTVGACMYWVIRLLEADSPVNICETKFSQAFFSHLEQLPKA